MIMYYEWDDIQCILDTESLHLFVEVKMPNGETITVHDRQYPNIRMLSSSFACQLSLGRAIEMLEFYEIPKICDLWFLNHYNGGRNE